MAAEVTATGRLGVGYWIDNADEARCVRCQEIVGRYVRATSDGGDLCLSCTRALAPKLAEIVIALGTLTAALSAPALSAGRMAEARRAGDDLTASLVAFVEADGRNGRRVAANVLEIVNVLRS